MLNQNQVRTLKTWGKSMCPDKSAQPQSTANLATHCINDFENPQSKSRGFTWVFCGIHLSYVFPLNKCTTKHISQRSVSHCANQERQQREGLSEAGRHTHFPRTSNQGPWDAAGTFSKTHKVPHPARTCQFSNQGELLSRKRYKSACSLTYHQYPHLKCFFPQSWCHWLPTNSIP